MDCVNVIKLNDKQIYGIKIQKKKKTRKKHGIFKNRSGKHVPVIYTPLTPHFLIVKPGFTGVYIIFSVFLLLNINCGYSLEPPQ